MTRCLLVMLAGCAATPKAAPAMRTSHEPEPRAAQVITPIEHDAAPDPLEIDLDALPWLAGEASFPNAEVTLNIQNDDRGWHVDVSGVPSSRAFETEARFFGWEPAPPSCRGSIRWHAIDQLLVYHTGAGVFRPGCKVVEVRTAEVAPVPFIEKLFLAFRRRCEACAGPREKLVLIGPAISESLGIAAVQNGPRSIVELPIEGASVAFSIGGASANEWAREIGARSWGKVDVIQVALEVAYPTAVARLTIGS